jgi:hypothetical protein
MSETILKIQLSELETLRIVCKKCKAAIEMPISMLDRRKGQNQRDLPCPGCGFVIRVGRADAEHGPIEDGLDLLVEAWEKLEPLKGNFDVQFVLPVKDGGWPGLNEGKARLMECSPGLRRLS